jgi:hypothetical protein
MKRDPLTNNFKKIESNDSYINKGNITLSPLRDKLNFALFRAKKVKDDLLAFRSKYENKEISLLEYLSICRSRREILNNLHQELNKGPKNFKIKIY